MGDHRDLHVLTHSFPTRRASLLPATDDVDDTEEPTRTTATPHERDGGEPAMHTPPVVSPQEWRAAREQLLVKEKAHTRARDALAAERRRMPWMAVEAAYAFEIGRAHV